MVIADVNDDGFPELVACDTRGNVGVFNWRGKEVWERHLRSLIAQGATVGDVNGDGRTEVVIGTSAGYIRPPLLGHFPALFFFAQRRGKTHDARALEHRARAACTYVYPEQAPLSYYTRHLCFPYPPSRRYVHVLDGRTGATATTRHKVSSTLFKQTAAFPFRTRGRLMAPILMVRLHDNLPQQHLVVLSFDGFLYTIDGMTGCALLTPLTPSILIHPSCSRRELVHVRALLSVHTVNQRRL